MKPLHVACVEMVRSFLIHVALPFSVMSFFNVLLAGFIRVLENVCAKSIMRFFWSAEFFGFLFPLCDSLVFLFFSPFVVMANH